MKHLFGSFAFLVWLLFAQNAFAQINYLRTPDSRFASLDGYSFDPHYFYVDDYEGGQLRMHYIDEGPKDAPTVLMIHGNPTWVYQFRHIIPPLNAAGYRTIAIDLMGMGRSDKPIDSLDYSYDRHVGWVTQLFTKIDSAYNLGPVTIFGHDYGTPIGLRMMVEHFPNRFDAFIDANASLPDGTFISPVHLNWRQFVRDNPDVPVGFVISSQLSEPLSQEEIFGYFAPWPDVAHKMAIRTFPEMVPDNPERPEAIANNTVWTFLEDFQKPFMTIFGSVDNNIFDARRDFIERVPGTYGQPQPQLNVTHYAPEDDPDAVAAEMIQFLKDVYHPVDFRNIEFSDFEFGFDGYQPGGIDCIYDNASQSVRIQGRDVIASSLILTEAIDLTTVEVIKVAFRYESINMVNGDGFIVELWDGASWVSILNLRRGEDFENGVWDYGFVRIKRDNINFSKDGRIRFRSNANTTAGAIYLRDIGIYTREATLTNIQQPILQENEIQVYPNPTNSIISVFTKFNTDLSYRILSPLGQVLDTGDLTIQNPSIDISSFPIGVYFVQFAIENSKYVITKRVLKTKS